MANGWLAENQQLAARIREMAEKGTLSHAIILTGSGDLQAAASFVDMLKERDLLV